MKTLLVRVAIAVAISWSALSSVVLAAARAESPHDWIEDAVVYGVVPRSFGGPARRDANDVIARLDAIAALGIDTLWLSPINATPRGDFGYAVTDHRRLRPDFGDERDLARLVREAHRRGLRVMLDFVPSHTSAEHRWFRDAKLRGRRSPHWGWYARDGAGRPVHDFDWAHLPKLDYDNPAVRRYMIESFAYWVRRCDVDGFRIDAAWSVARRRPDFYRTLAARLRAIKPSVALLAEASARETYWAGASVDAGYDWTDRLGEWAWNDAFSTAFDTASPAERAARVRAAIFADPPEPALPALRFLDNNDTGARFVTRHGPAMTRAAAVLVMTLPGVPLVYTGEEVGAEFHPYEQGARGPQGIDWTDRHQLRGHYSRLIALRKRVAALRSREVTPVATGARSAAVAYVRGGGDGGNERGAVLVIVDLGGEGSAVVRLPAAIAGRVEGERALEDLLGDRRVAVERAGDGELRVAIPRYGALVLALP